jgi:hypothetical protein
MKKTLQDQYLLIKEGKGHKGVFLADAKRQFPNIVRNAATFEEASSCLITKNIIAENVIGLTAVNSPFEPKKKESYELAFENFLAEAKKKGEDEKVKAEEKKVSKPVEEDLSHNFDYKDDKNPDNLIFDQIMMGYYTEMKDPKNVDKTMQELKDMVLKNLAKDPIFYTKEGQFGVKGLGYSVDHPGLGEPKEPKGKYKASGYGDLNEGIHDRDILSRPLSNPDYEPFERSSEELGNEADNRSKNILLSTYSQQINNPKISDDELRYILGGKGVKGFGGRPNAIDKIIKDRNKGNKIEDIDSLEREARITLSSKGYSPFSLRSYSRQELIDLANKSESTENKSLEESKLRKVIREMIDAELSILPKTSLKESVEKELAAINKEAEHEIIASKLEKVQTLIDKKQTQISRLDEDEDLKDLTDAKKVKEISKDIKSLEKAKAKLEKMMHKGKAKSPRKEVIDETDEIIDEAELNEIPTKDTEELDTIYKTLNPAAKELQKTLQDTAKIKLEEKDEMPEYVKSALKRKDEGEDLENILKDYSDKQQKEIKTFITTQDYWEQDSDIGQSKKLEIEEEY